MTQSIRYGLALAILALATSAAADDRSDYYRRAASQDMASFHALDINHDNLLARSEIAGDNDFGPRFDDVDINRDGIVTPAEMQRYVEQHYGVSAPGGGK
jgi:hypothetical protein